MCGGWLVRARVVIFIVYIVIKRVWNSNGQLHFLCGQVIYCTRHSAKSNSTLCQHSVRLLCCCVLWILRKNVRKSSLRVNVNWCTNVTPAFSFSSQVVINQMPLCIFLLNATNFRQYNKENFFRKLWDLLKTVVLNCTINFISWIQEELELWST